MTRDHGALLLALGDIASFVAFGALGMASHGDPLTAKSVARAIVLFPAAWLLLASLLGAYSDDAIDGRTPITWLALIWIPAGVIELCLRAAIFDRALFNAFFAVALVGYGVFLIGWRAAYSRWLAPATG